MTHPRFSRMLVLRTAMTPASLAGRSVARADERRCDMAGLEGKVALITGAGGMKGIGRATALKLAAQGANIVLTDVQRTPEDLPPGEVRRQWRGIDSVAEEVEGLGRHCLRLWCDLSSSEQIQAMVRQAEEHFGRI